MVICYTDKIPFMRKEDLVVLALNHYECDNLAEWEKKPFRLGIRK